MYRRIFNHRNRISVDSFQVLDRSQNYRIFNVRTRINKQFVWRAHQQRVIMPEFNIINVIKELLNVKYNFASVPVLDLADIVFSIESLSTE